jgi:hypothetical protein
MSSLPFVQQWSVLVNGKKLSREDVNAGNRVKFSIHTVAQVRVFGREYFVLFCNLFCFCFCQSSARGHHYTVVLHKQLPYRAISVLSFRQRFYDVIIIRIKCNFLSVTDNSTDVCEYKWLKGRFWWDINVVTV